MPKEVNFKKGKWIKKPKLFIQSDNSLIFETEPFTDIHDKGDRPCAEIRYELSNNFMFSIKTDYHYHNVFDQCGLVLYRNDERIAIIGTQYYDSEITRIQAITYHDNLGDRSIRDIASNIHSLYYRLWHRDSIIRIQYSFNGKRYRDFREFPIKDDDKYMIGLYSCSPINSIFDCTFSEFVMEE